MHRDHMAFAWIQLHLTPSLLDYHTTSCKHPVPNDSSIPIPQYQTTHLALTNVDYMSLIHSLESRIDLWQKYRPLGLPLNKNNRLFTRYRPGSEDLFMPMHLGTSSPMRNSTKYLKDSAKVPTSRTEMAHEPCCMLLCRLL